MKRLALVFPVSIFLSIILCLSAHADLYFPHIASNDTYETEIALINESATDNTTGTLTGYTDAGVAVSGILSINLPPGGRRQIIIGDQFEQAFQMGHIVFATQSTKVVGYTKFYNDGTYRVALPAVTKVATDELYVTHIASDDFWWTGIGLVNTTMSPKSITITFSDDTSRTLVLPAMGHTAFSVASLFDDVSQPDIESAVIDNASGLVGLELFGGGNILSGITLKEVTDNELYFPHLSSDQQWWTGLVAYNASPVPCDITIAPYTASGTALTSQALTLEANGKYMGNAKVLGLPDATAWFKLSGDCPLTGFELFGTKDFKQLAGFTSVGIDNTEGTFKKIEKDGWTGIAFVNTTDLSSTINLVARDDTGAVIQTESTTLNPYEKMVGRPQELFTDDISSATYITYSSSQELVGFQLNGSMGKMMLDGLPAWFNEDTSGNGGNNNCLDAIGVWQFSVFNINSSCGPESSWNSTVTINQNDCSLETAGLKNSSNLVTGSVEADVVTIGPEDFSEDGGTTTTTFHLRIESDTEMSGSETWRWSGPGGPCVNGTAQVTAIKVN